MNNLGIFYSKSFFFNLASLKKVEQSIYIFIGLFLTIINPKIVLRELLSPADLAGAQTLHIYKTITVVIVSKNKALILTTFQVVAPSLEGFNKS